MALSELDMMNLWAKQLTGYKSQWERLFDFGYAIEAEVRKSDEACAQVAMEFRRGAGDPVCGEVATAIRERGES